MPDSPGGQIGESWQAIRQSDWPAAAALAREALAANEGAVEAGRALAIAVWAGGDCANAIAVLEQFVPADPPDALFWCDLGTLQFSSENYFKAAAAFHRSASLDRSLVSAFHGLGESLLRLHRLDEARPVLEHCVSRDPANLLYGRALAQCLSDLGDDCGAEALIDAYLAREPGASRLRLLKASIASRARDYSRALSLATAAAECGPPSFETAASLAVARFGAGDYAGASQAGRAALALTPNDRDLHGRLLVLALHDPSFSALEIRGLHVEAARFWARGKPARECHDNVPDPDRKLRVGYLSSEFLMNPSYCFLAVWLQHQDRAAFTSYYYTTRAHDWKHTQRYRAMADQWRDVWQLNHRQTAELIERDGIDILVDFSGYFSHNLFPVFSRKPAPVQITYPHYPSTTGVEQFDYLLTDNWTTPPGTEHEYAEKIYRIPSGYIAYQSIADLPPVAQPPALSNGYVTFGLFQRPGKYHPEFWSSVAAILRRLPSARVLIHFESAELDSPGSAAQQRMLGLMAGVEKDRILFAGSRTIEEHVRVIAEADIALDSHPYNGQTTTCDCLWMGVPVVNLRGVTHAGRVGQGLLARVGLSELSTNTVEEYVNCAVSLAGDIERLAKLRCELRERAEAALGNGALLAREIEDAYRFAWRQWCARQSHCSDTNV